MTLLKDNINQLLVADYDEGREVGCYHFGLGIKKDDHTWREKIFAGREKVLLITGGEGHRMEEVQHQLAVDLGIWLPELEDQSVSVRRALVQGAIEQRIPLAGLGHLRPLFDKSSRFLGFALHPEDSDTAILAVNHGMGMPSTEIMLNEVLKMIAFADIHVENIEGFRAGTSGGDGANNEKDKGEGGVGVEAGTIVVANKALDTRLNEYFLLEDGEGFTPLLAEVSSVFADRLYDTRGSLPVVRGLTVSADGFYNAQRRLDGILPTTCTSEIRQKWLEKLADRGVKCIAMEAFLILAYCRKLGIENIAAVKVALLNRMKSDLVNPEDYVRSTQNLKAFTVSAIKRELGIFA